MPINPNWFSQNAPQMQPGIVSSEGPGGWTGHAQDPGWGQLVQTPSAGMQPGGGGFQEQQPGAMPLPNTSAGPFNGLITAGQLAGAKNLMQEWLGPIGQAQLGGAGMAQAAAQPSQEEMGMAQNLMSRFLGPIGQGQQGAMQGNVLLRAPDGSTKSVPAHQMGHWLGRGAVRF